MKSLRHTLLMMRLSLTGALVAPVVQAAPEFINGLALDGAMLDEGGGDGRCNRLVKFSTATGAAIAQYAYQMEGSSQGRGISTLIALNDHEFPVLEPNNRHIGVGADVTVRQTSNSIVQSKVATLPYGMKICRGQQTGRYGLS